MASDEDELWSQAYAQPGDLEVRAVLADALSERGDARGPFIAAQLAGDTRRPPTELARMLLGPIVSALLVGSVDFENGFPVSGITSMVTPSSMFLNREWATFRSIDGLQSFGPALISLTRATDVSFFALDEWIRHRWPLPVRELGINGSSASQVADLPCEIESLTIEHALASEELGLDYIFEAVRDVKSLKTLRIEAPTILVASGFARDDITRWPRWRDVVPSLRTVEWELRVGVLRLSSVDTRFDSLRLIRNGHAADEDLEAKLRTLGTPARYFSVE